MLFLITHANKTWDSSICAKNGIEQLSAYFSPNIVELSDRGSKSCPRKGYVSADCTTLYSVNGELPAGVENTHKLLCFSGGYFERCLKQTFLEAVWRSENSFIDVVLSGDAVFTSNKDLDGTLAINNISNQDIITVIRSGFYCDTLGRPYHSSSYRGDIYLLNIRGKSMIIENKRHNFWRKIITQKKKELSEEERLEMLIDNFRERFKFDALIEDYSIEGGVFENFLSVGRKIRINYFDRAQDLISFMNNQKFTVKG